MAHHTLDQVVGHRQSRLCPLASALIVAQPDPRGNGHPEHKQRQVQPAARTERQHQAGERKLDERRQPEEAAGDGHLLEHL
jgi:hypothetical protein